MSCAIYWGNYDETYSIFKRYIKSNYEKVILCVDDIYIYDHYKHETTNLLLSTKLPENPNNVDCVAFSTNGFEGKTIILKKIITSLNHTNINGQVIIITSKKTGETFIKKVLNELQIPIETQFRDSKYHLLCINKNFSKNIELDKYYNKFSLNDEIIIKEKIKDIDFTFHSSQQLFSKENVDKGSKFLLNTIKLQSNIKLLDYGCGYGIIGIGAAKIFNVSDVSFVDIKAIAYEKTIENIKINNLTNKTDVFLTTDLRQCCKKFDVVLSHFPIHVSNDKKIKMLQNCYDVLNKNGKLICVIPLTFDFEKLVNLIFQNYKLISKDTILGYYIFETIKK